LQNSINLLGIEVSKKTYSLIMWGVTFCLAIISTILFLMYKRGYLVVSEAKARLKEVQEELEKLRKSAILREQMLGNELMSYKRNHK